MKPLFFIFAFISVMSFTMLSQADSNISPTQDTNKPIEPKNSLKNTEVAGFFIGQEAEAAVDVCMKELTYEVGLFPTVDPSVLMLQCEPNEDLDTAAYNLKTRGKPNHVLILFINGKVFGIHAIYTKNNVYKKALVSLINSDIIKYKVEDIPSVGNVQLYLSPSENWISWYTATKGVVIEKNKEIEKRIYIIHMEYFVETKEEDKNNDH